jgi:hypothetical protein
MKHKDDLNDLNHFVLELLIHVFKQSFCDKDHKFMFDKLRNTIIQITSDLYNHDIDYDKLSERDKLFLKTPITKLLMYM